MKPTYKYISSTKRIGAAITAPIHHDATKTVFTLSSQATKKRRQPGPGRTKKSHHAFGQVTKLITTHQHAERALHANLLWWINHYLDLPFHQWKENLWNSQRLSIRQFALELVNHNVLGKVDDTEAAANQLASEINQWLRGKTQPSVYLLYAICKPYNLSIENWLLTEH